MMLLQSNVIELSDELPSQDQTAHILDVAVRAETEVDEKVLWTGRPDHDAIAMQLLPFPVCWLTGLFVFSMGVLKSTDGDTSQMVMPMVILLVIVAIMGLLEIVSVPWQARRTIFVITDRRSFILKLRARLGYKDLNDYSLLSRKLVRPEKNTMNSYFCYTVPTHIIFFYIVFDLAISLVFKGDLFVLGGFALIVIGWLYQWYSDMRYPLPRFRECPRAFYYINEWLATVESVPHQSVKKSILHERKSGNGDIFVIAPTKGCMRMKAIPQAKEVFLLLAEQLPKKPGSKSDKGSQAP